MTQKSPFPEFEIRECEIRISRLSAEGIQIKINCRFLQIYQIFYMDRNQESVGKNNAQAVQYLRM